MARRKLDPSVRLSRVVSFKVTDDEWTSLKSVADGADLSIGEYARQLVLEKKVVLKAVNPGRSHLTVYLPLFNRAEAAVVRLALQAHKEMVTRHLTREEYLALLRALDRAIAPLREVLPW